MYNTLVIHRITPVTRVAAYGIGLWVPPSVQRPDLPLEPSLGGGRPAVGSHRDRDGQEGRRDERSFAQNSSILTKPSAPPSSRTSLARIQVSHPYHLDGVTTMSGLPLSLRETSTEPKVCDHNAKEGLRQGSALPSYIRLRRISHSGCVFRPVGRC